jgi:hypothetical protein
MGSLILPDGAEPDPCDRLTADQLARLRGAARLLAEQRGLVPRVGGWLGGHAERVVGMLGEGWRERVQALVEEALWRAQGVATLGMAPMPLEVAGGPRAVSRGWLARAATTASGAATGFVGLPGVALDIPFTTLTILRSIADIARAEGEDIAAEEGRRACLEVLAIGGPGGADDEAQLGYWTARLGLAGLNLSAVVPQAARMLGAVLSEKVLAQAVPLAGAVAGAGLNYVFIRYYQHMARVHFTVRAIERAHDGDPAVRACLDRMVARARASGAAGTRPSRES